MPILPPYHVFLDYFSRIDRLKVEKTILFIFYRFTICRLLRCPGFEDTRILRGARISGAKRVSGGGYEGTGVRGSWGYRGLGEFGGPEGTEGTKSRRGSRNTVSFLYIYFFLRLYTLRNYDIIGAISQGGVP